MIRYAFRESAILYQRKADPQTYGEAIRALGDADGYVSPDSVWRAARHPAHPLHGEYEWDRKKAAEAHWRDRSRHLIAAIYLVSADNLPNRPAYFNLRVAEGRRYVPEEVAGSDALLRLELVRVAVRELRQFRRRFSRLTFVAAPIDTAIEAAEQHLADAEQATYA